MGQIDAGRAAEARGLGETLDTIHPQLFREMIKIYVAGTHDGLRHVHAAVAAALPAPENLIAQLDLTAAKHALPRPDALFQKHGRHHQFPDRSRRIHALNDPVLERETFVGAQLLPVLMGNARGEKIVVVGGRRHQGAEFARVRLHDDDASRLPVQSVPGGPLDAGIQREPGLLTAVRFFQERFAERTSQDVHFNLI